MATTQLHSASANDKKIVITQQIKLNEMLWGKVDKLEFMLQQQMEKKDRDERRFVKKLVRLAKYLELKGMNSQEIATILRQNREQNHAFDMEHKSSIFGDVDKLLRKGSQQGLDQPKIGSILGKKTYQSESEEIDEMDLQIERKRIEKNKKKKLRQLAKLKIQDQQQQDPNSITQQQSNQQQTLGDDTESDSDFENMKMTARGERQYLEDYLTLGELGGKIPPSLLINVNFEKFAQENGFDLIDFEGNINNEKK